MFQFSVSNFLFYIIFSSIPAFGWLLVCLYFDRQAPEPKMEIWRMFFSGLFITLIVFLVTGPLSILIDKILKVSVIITIIIISFFVDSLIEELAKYFTLRIGMYSRAVFDEPRDGMIYGMTVGIGFAFMESVLYATASSRFIEGLSLVFLRAISVSFMHFLAGGIIGYYLGLAKFIKETPGKQRILVFQGLFLTTIFHGLYNTIVRAGSIWCLLPMSLLLIVTYIFILKGLRRLAKFKN